MRSMPESVRSMEWLDASLRTKVLVVGAKYLKRALRELMNIGTTDHVKPFFCFGRSWLRENKCSTRTGYTTSFDMLPEAASGRRKEMPL